MKILSENRNVEIMGAVRSRTSEVRVNRAMMMLLSKQYSDYPWAIVREYGTNMVDGYTALRRERPNAPILPPVIRLPHALAPHIEFEDFGIGMTSEQLWRVFPDYGASTKQDSNDEVGGFGIGAKVANYYEKADVWFVESRYDGTLYSLHITRNAEGLPTYNEMPPRPTDAPNGVTVRIPVPASEWAHFERAAIRLATYLPLPVKLIGGTGAVTAPKPEYLLTGTGWGLRKGRDSQAVVGNVPYPLDVGLLCTRLNIPAGIFYNLALDFSLPVGEVEVAPDREKLIYEDLTNKRLMEALTTFRDEVNVHAAQRIERQPDLWGALTLLRREWATSGLGAVLTAVEWRGRKLSFSGGMKYTLTEVEKNHKRGPLAFRVCELAQTGSTVVVREWPRQEARFDMAASNEARMQDRHYLLDPAYIDTHPFFLNDLGKEGEDRIRHAVRERTTSVNRAGRRSRRNNSNYKIYVVEGERATKESVSEAFFGAPILLASELAAPPVEARVSRKTSVKVLTDRFSWEDATVDRKDGGLYIELERDKVIEGHSLHTLMLLLNLGKQLGVVAKDARLYGIPRSCKALEKAPGWHKLLPVVRDAVRKNVAKVADQMALFSLWREALPQNRRLFLLIDRLHKAGVRGEVAEIVAEKPEPDGARTKEFDTLLRAAQVLGVGVPSGNVARKPVSMVDNFYRKYPMVRLLILQESWHFDRLLDDAEFVRVVAEYIRTQDAVSGRTVARAAA
jgi:hypothetical protein